MNKLIISLFALMVLFSFIGCTSKTESFYTSGTFERDTKTKTSVTSVPDAYTGVYYKAEFSADKVVITYKPTIDAATGSYTEAGTIVNSYTIDKNYTIPLNFTTASPYTYTVYYSRLENSSTALLTPFAVTTIITDYNNPNANSIAFTFTFNQITGYSVTTATAPISSSVLYMKK